MAGGSAKIEGARELKLALRNLGKSLGKGVLRRVGKKRLVPMRDAAIANAPEKFGDLKKDIKVGTTLAKSQRGRRGEHIGGGAFRTPSKDDVTVYMGPGLLPQAIIQEFGSFKEDAQPYMRPAFDAEADGVIDGIGDDLWAEIAKTAARQRRKAARRAGG